jgi:hypothetical protein
MLSCTEFSPYRRLPSSMTKGERHTIGYEAATF